MARRDQDTDSRTSWQEACGEEGNPLGPFGITVNAICPGLFDTEMTRKQCTPEQIARWESTFPIPRLGTPEEIAALALFLASEDAAYITGASIDINGGDLML